MKPGKVVIQVAYVLARG